MNNPRQVTETILYLVEEGALDKDFLIMACLKYMSEDEVKDMAEINEILIEGELDERD